MILFRLGVVLAIFCVVFLVLWLDRAGLRDQADGEVSFADVVAESSIVVQ